MNESEPQKKPFALVAILTLVFAGVLWIATRPQPQAKPVQREVLLANLNRVENRFVLGGTSNHFTGLAVEYYRSTGKLKSRTVISNGFLHGLSEGWYTNGQIQVMEYFTNGVSHGRRMKWYADGSTQSVANIIAGKLEGEFRRWHTNGRLSQLVMLSNGLPHGVSEAWFPNGSRKARAVMNAGKIVEQEFFEDPEAAKDKADP